MALSSVSVVLTSTLSSPGSASTPKHPEQVSGGPTGSYVVPAGIHKIKHVIIVEQENRSFDSYFGTYPGADGIPMKHGTPIVCVSNPAGGCTKPYHDTADVNGGGPHGYANAKNDVNGGKMNGFVAQATNGPKGCLISRTRRAQTPLHPM